MEKRNIEVKREEVFDTKMVKNIKVGDPMYFEQQTGLDLTYSKRFRRPGWFGRMKIIEQEEVFSFRGEDRTFTETIAKIFFAPNEEILSTYLNNKVYVDQKVKETSIGVDTARYIVEVQDRLIEVGTGSDGFMGTVWEIYMKSKLEGVMIELSGLDMNDFERFRDEFKYISGVK